MTEEGFFDVLRELDTIHDFANYLQAKETWIAGDRCVVIEGSELNLVALYVSHGRTFAKDADRVIVPDGLWQEMLGRPEFQKRKTLDRESYVWDALVEQLSDPTAKPIEGSSAELSELERALRAMARENRFGRRVLGQGLREFLENAVAGHMHLPAWSAEDDEHANRMKAALGFFDGASVQNEAGRSNLLDDIINADWDDDDGEPQIHAGELSGPFRKRSGNASPSKSSMAINSSPWSSLMS